MRIKSNFELGTAYLTLKESEVSSSDTLPIDDAYILVDQKLDKIVGFKFDMNNNNQKDWMESWTSLNPSLFQCFSTNLQSNSDIEFSNDTYFIESSVENSRTDLKAIPAAAYIDFDSAGNALGIEFLFKSKSNA